MTAGHLGEARTGRYNRVKRRAMTESQLTFNGVKAELRDINICYETFGDPRDPAILLIADFGQQMLGWDAQFCQQLAVMGYWVIRFDNRDMGRSSWLHHDPPSRFALAAAFLVGTGVRIGYTLDDMAEDALGLLDYLRLEKVHVVGIGLGGMIGQLMAAAEPERVKTLASLMSSAGDMTIKMPGFSLVSQLFAPLADNLDDYCVQMATISELLSGPRYPFASDAVRRRATLAFHRGLNDAGVVRQLATLLMSTSRREQLRTLTQPVLVVHGDHDPLIPVEHAIDTAALIPTANLRIIAGLGHTLPAAFWVDLIGDLVKHFNNY